jgi:hypothetical protein
VGDSKPIGWAVPDFNEIMQVRNGCTLANVTFAETPPFAALPPDCENIRALVILFPDLFSIIYNTKNLGQADKYPQRDTDYG